MAKWLDKYEQGGLVLKKKTKDNYGTKPNVNDVKVSAGPNFVGEGYTAYNWKSPAWGGQFAMGGSLPGSVGFMYARTQNPAPANGKYTKKTLASAQNGQEMKYYQDGLDFRPKSISKNGKKFVGYPMAQTGITTNIESGTSNPTVQLTTLAKEAERKAKEKAKDKATVADRKKRIAASVAAKKQPFSAQQLADVTQATGDKFRLFPNDPDSFFDEYINPGVFIGNLASGMGRVPLDIQQGNYGRAALNAAMPAMIGAGEAIAAPYLKQAGNFITKNIPLKNSYPVRPTGGGISQAEIERAMQQVNALNDQGLSRRVQPSDYSPFQPTATPRTEAQTNFLSRLMTPEQLAGMQDEQLSGIGRSLLSEREAAIRQRTTPMAPYQPPTEAELASMNQAEANMYYRRPSQVQTVPAPEPTQINTPDPDSFDWSIPRDSQAESAAQAAQNDMARAASAPVNENALVHPNNRTMTERVLRRRQQSLRDLYGFTEAEIAADEAALRRGEPLRTPAQIRGGGQGTFDLNRNRPVTPTKEWDPKTFRIGEGDEEGIIKMSHPEGHTIKQEISRGTDSGASTYRNYEISDSGKSSNYIKVETSQNPGDPFTDVNDISFFNRDPNSSSKQMNIVFSHLPTKARIQPINTSVHSQPLLNTRMAKLSSGQPGRIQIQPERISALNKITRDIAGKPLDWYNDVISQFPKLQRTNQTLNEYTGASLQEPFIRYKGEKLPFEEFNTPEMKRLFEDPHSAYDVLHNTDVMVNKYKTIKNWKNGGHYIDSMGQWAHPGDITTIPSNDITMRGVNYDVMGISNTGDKKLMKPGKNYKFDGDYVTEYPRGGWLEKYK